MTQITELQEALVELSHYLSDRIPPLMVADSITVLFDAPADFVADEIQVWAQGQQQDAPEVSNADFLYHAIKKIAILGELDLVPRETLTRYLGNINEALLAYCPPEDREFLRQNLERLALNATHAGTRAMPLEVLHRQSGSQVKVSGQTATEVPAGYRRLSVFLDRLRPQGQGSISIDRRNELTSHFITTAAAHAKSEKELERHLAPLREHGLETPMDQLFRVLAYTLPGWGSLAGVAAADGTLPRVGAQVDAMRQIVALAPDAGEGAKRLRDLVHAAVEQFNEGNLGRAVTMFELAESLIAENKIPAMVVDALRLGHEPLHYERLRRFAERSDSRAGLRAVMNFYVGLRPDGLLDALNGEPKRERRHEILALLEAHEDAARTKAFERLKASIDNPEAKLDPYFQMNLVYLLRVIPRPKDAPIEDEVSAVTRTPGRESPPPLVKQVIAYLGYTRHDKCERALITYLHVFENMLLLPNTAVYDKADVETLLDRTCAALARYGTARAWRALIDHGLKTDFKLGSPTARLVEAGRQDLSSSPDLVERLIYVVRAELQPKTLIGAFVKNEDRIIWLVQALSGTPLPEVRAVFEDIAAKHPRTRFGEAAAKALATLGAASRPASNAGLSGDLELFGLPGVLQTLGQSQMTGVISLMNATGKTQAVVLLDEGRFRGAQYLHLRGAHAAYQLLERPFPGTFAFVSRSDVGTLPPAAPARDIIGIILEGVRRHDEFKRAAALVPDDAVLQAAAKAATTLPDEEQQLIEVVWNKVVARNTPHQIESLITRDGYHVRRLLAHWVEEGSLRLA